MSWIENVTRNILPLSHEKLDIKVALTEWFYTENAYDLDQEREDCELCDHPHIRYQFEICNRYTQNLLLVGSECITKFDIRAIDEEGKVLTVSETKRKVRNDRVNLQKTAREKRMITSLIKLASADSDFQIDSFINYVQSRGAFTPNQLSFLVWRLNKYDIPHRPTDFKVTIKKNREKEQLINMLQWKLDQIWPYLKPRQKEFYKRKYG